MPSAARHCPTGSFVPSLEAQSQRFDDAPRPMTNVPARLPRAVAPARTADGRLVAQVLRGPERGAPLRMRGPAVVHELVADGIIV